MSKGTTNRTIRINDTLWAAATSQATQDDTTISETIRAHLTQWVQEPHNTTPDTPKPATAPQTHNHQTNPAQEQP